MTAIVRDDVDDNRRRLLIVATGVAGAAVVGGVAAPFLASWFPSARALAAGAPVEADISKMEPGQQITIEWRGKPVWVLKRTPEMVQGLPNHDALLVDPESKDADQPKYVKGPERSIKPEIFVATGVCTHLGCSPTLKKEIGAASDMGSDWPGGYYCPCHNSRFTRTGEVTRGPDPTGAITIRNLKSFTVTSDASGVLRPPVGSSTNACRERSVMPRRWTDTSMRWLRPSRSDGACSTLSR